MGINEYLRFLRLSHNLTMDQLGKEIGLSAGLISDIENGRSKFPRADTLMKLADYFNVSVDEILGRQNLSKQGGEPLNTVDEDIKEICCLAISKDEIEYAMENEHGQLSKYPKERLEIAYKEFDRDDLTYERAKRYAERVVTSTLEMLSYHLFGNENSIAEEFKKFEEDLQQALITRYIRREDISGFSVELDYFKLIKRSERYIL